MKNISTVLALGCLSFLTACQFNINSGIKGNGKVISQNRNVQEDFHSVRASAGMQVFLSEGTANTVVVEADENLLPYIKTDVENGHLHITTSENLGRASSKKVYVTYTALDTVEVSSGAEVTGNSVIKSENLDVKSSSGGSVNLELFSKNTTAQSSSGGSCGLSGKTANFSAQASSGGSINARKLESLDCKAKASSGGSITLNARDTLEATVSSGGSVSYYGDPTLRSNKSTSGTVKKIDG